MEKSKVDMYLAGNSDKFAPENLAEIKQILETLPDEKLVVLQSVSLKDPTTMLIISIVAGSLGVDRFMLGDTGLGVLKLLTSGGCGIWTIVDWFNIKKMTRKHNYDKFKQAASM